MISAASAREKTSAPPESRDSAGCAGACTGAVRPGGASADSGWHPGSLRRWIAWRCLIPGRSRAAERQAVRSRRGLYQGQGYERCECEEQGCHSEGSRHAAPLSSCTQQASPRKLTIDNVEGVATMAQGTAGTGRPIGIGIVGCGIIARTHIRALLAFPGRPESPRWPADRRRASPAPPPTCATRRGARRRSRGSRRPRARGELPRARVASPPPTPTGRRSSPIRPLMP